MLTQIQVSDCHAAHLQFKRGITTTINEMCLISEGRLPESRGTNNIKDDELRRHVSNLSRGSQLRAPSCTPSHQGGEQGGQRPSPSERSSDPLPAATLERTGSAGAAGPPSLKPCRLGPRCAASIHHEGERRPSHRRPPLCGKILYSHPKPALTCRLVAKKSPLMGRYWKQSPGSAFLGEETVEVNYLVYFRGFNCNAAPCLMNVLSAALLINISSECSISSTEEKQLLFLIFPVGIWLDSNRRVGLY